MYLTSCSNCDWTLTDAESIRVYVNGNEFPPFQLESDGLKFMDFVMIWRVCVPFVLIRRLAGIIHWPSEQKPRY